MNRRKPVRLLCLILILTLAAALSYPAQADDERDFVIRDGVLTHYLGPGGDVTIPDGVTVIGERVFASRNNLTRITIPDSVTRIEDEAFFCCSGLREVSIPESVRYMGSGVFYNCTGLTEVRIPERMTDIPDWAFFCCDNLKSVYIPEGVTSIGDWTFCGCKSLETIAIPASVTHIGDRALGSCIAMTDILVAGGSMTYCSIDGVLFDLYGSKLLVCPGGRRGAYTVPDGVTVIWDYAFYGCGGLTEVRIPYPVKGITEGAFLYCLNLERVSIPSSMIYIGDQAFSECPKLAVVDFPGSREQWEAIELRTGNEALLQAELRLGAEAADYPEGLHIQDGVLINYNGPGGDLVLPERVTSIGAEAFRLCESLRSVTIPGSVTGIGEDAFTGCTALTVITVEGNGNYRSIDGVLFDASGAELLVFPCGRSGAYSLPDGVSRIGNDAFYGCSGLTELRLPEGVTDIGSRAFFGCAGLGGMTLPGSLKTVGDQAFFCCDSLKWVEYAGTREQWDALEIGSGNEDLLRSELRLRESLPPETDPPSPPPAETAQPPAPDAASMADPAAEAGDAPESAGKLLPILLAAVIVALGVLLVLLRMRKK